MKLKTRREIISMWLQQKDEMLDSYVCPDCRDILAFDGDGKLKCLMNHSCMNLEEYEVNDADREVSPPDVGFWNLPNGRFKQLVGRVFRKKCKHKNTVETFRCYQDRYYTEKCLDCGASTYKGMDE